jgi:hypothetical protein
MKELTRDEAYSAMFEFVGHRYELTQSKDIASFMMDIQIMEDGVSADPALIDDWNEAVDKVLLANR